MSELVYWSAMAVFFTHELHAVNRHEWRIFPLLCLLPDLQGRLIFIWAHIPLFCALLWFSRGGVETVFALGFSVFAVIHVLLHWLLRKHPANEFNNTSSWLLICLTGVLGAIHIAIVTG